MTALIAKYGKLALALIAIFLSGQAIGWMLALHSCEARPPAGTDTEDWSSQMLARLEDDLGLSETQTAEVRARLHAVSSKMQRHRDAALFQIHLELIMLHDDLAPGLTAAQQNKLAISRQKLVESTSAKFPELLRDTAVPPTTRDPAAPTPP